MISTENMAWLKSLPYQHKLDDVEVLLCHGSPVRLEEFEYIFAPEQARECLPLWDKLGHITLIGHSHLCKVFALTKSGVEELPAVDFELAPDKKRFEFKRIEYDIELSADKVLRARLERNFAHRLFIGV
jgi:hypothetical protein